MTRLGLEGIVLKRFTHLDDVKTICAEINRIARTNGQGQVYLDGKTQFYFSSGRQSFLVYSSFANIETDLARGVEVYLEPGIDRPVFKIRPSGHMPVQARPVEEKRIRWSWREGELVLLLSDARAYYVEIGAVKPRK